MPGETAILVLSHRGYWKDAQEKNTLEAFRHSFSQGFGTETDIRDYGGELVISHDVADENCPRVRELLDLHSSIDSRLPLALNIKADGLAGMLKELLDEYEVENYFVFDMSVPDTLSYLKEGVRTFVRLSEYEVESRLYEKADGVWLDGFESDWVRDEDINGHLANGKRVCVVSSELHGREQQEFWARLVQMPNVDDPKVMICTDYPEEMLGFVNGESFTRMPRITNERS